MTGKKSSGPGASLHEISFSFKDLNSDIAAISTSLQRLSILFGLSNPSVLDSLKYILQLIIPLFIKHSIIAPAYRLVGKIGLCSFIKFETILS